MDSSSEEFYRIQKLPPYVFAVINEMRAKARAAQIDVIDLVNWMRPVPPTSAGWVMMLLGGGSLSGLGMALRRKRWRIFSATEDRE